MTLPLSKYSGSSMGNLPIGQGELVTPMQMATAYRRSPTAASCARPTSSARSPARRCRSPPGTASSPQTTAAELRQMLEGVLGSGRHRQRGLDPRLRSWRARRAPPARSIRPPANTPKSAYVASFIGFAPASDPKLLCAVVVDEPQNGSIFGGTVAAPAFGQIMASRCHIWASRPAIARGSLGGGN